MAIARVLQTDTSCRVAAWLAAVLLSCTLQSSCIVAQSDATGQDYLAEPYLLFGAHTVIYRLYLNDSTPQELLTDRDGGISDIDFHYRMDLLFWVNGVLGRPGVKSARLRDGSNITTIASRVSSPAGIAVDWINDKVYWTNQGVRTIEEYDIRTTERRLVIRFNPQSTQLIPTALALFPQKDYGWLYTMGGRSKSLHRIPVDGSRIDIMMSQVDCTGAVTVDHMTRFLYWTDTCSFEIEKSQIDGSNHSVILGVLPAQEVIRFSYGLATFEDTLYWTQQNKVYKYVNFKQQRVLVHETKNRHEIFSPLIVVHPRKQPSLDELSGDGTCTPKCQNGRCIPPGLCSCNRGWTGLTCEDDINECANNNGGCSHSCNNLEGSFNCSCPKGLFLQIDGKQCSDFDPGLRFPSPINVTSTVSNLPTSQTSVDSLSYSFSVTPSTTPTITTSIAPPLPTPTSAEQYSTSLYTIQTETLRLHSSSSSFMNVNSKPSVTPYLGTIPTDGLDDRKEASNSTLLVIVATSLGLCIIIGAVLIYMIVLYSKHQIRKRGSYNVQRRGRTHDLERGTSSARSSFRRVSDFFYTETQPMTMGSSTSLSQHSTTPSLVPAQSLSSTASETSSSSSEAQETDPLNTKSR